MRLDKFLSNLKYGSRKEVKKILKKEHVKVNGKIVTDGSFHIDPKNDLVTINDKKIYYQKYLYLMLNKPQGYISATYDNYHKTIIDLLDDKYKRFQLFPCGRLDIETEGLIILTNDGEFAHKLMHPKKEIYKTYYVEVEKALSDDDKYAFYQGLEILDGNNQIYQTKRAYLNIIDKYKATVSIAEGKYHQVKRMFKKRGNKVIYLKRIKIGALSLDEDLKLGEVKELTDKDLALLFIKDNEMEE